MCLFTEIMEWSHFKTFLLDPEVALHTLRLGQPDFGCGPMEHSRQSDWLPTATALLWGIWTWAK